MSTDFIGPREGWDEHAAGTIRFEIDMELWSNSGREKHVDIEGQGWFLAQTIVRQLRDMEPAPDVALHTLRYFGKVEPTPDAPFDQDIGQHPA